MSAREESDEPEVSQRTLHGLIADLNPQPHPQSRITQAPTWAFPSRSSSSPSPGAMAEASPSANIFPQRMSSRNHTRPLPELDLATTTASVQHPTLFNTPNRSIFSSGPPTSSLSANTAQASMSAPSPASSTHPLSSLTVPASTSNRRTQQTVHYENDNPTSSSRNARHARVEKDVDDPSSPVDRTRSTDMRNSSTPTALTRLFAAPETSTPADSRHASYIRTQSGTPYTRGTFATETTSSSIDSSITISNTNVFQLHCQRRRLSRIISTIEVC